MEGYRWERECGLEQGGGLPQEGQGWEELKYLGALPCPPEVRDGHMTYSGRQNVSRGNGGPFWADALKARTCSHFCYVSSVTVCRKGHKVSSVLGLVLPSLKRTSVSLIEIPRISKYCYKPIFNKMVKGIFPLKVN